MLSREHLNALQREWLKRNPRKAAMRASNCKEREARIREEVINAYGGMCSHCGETDDFVLEIDHVFNDGSKHRKETGLHSLNRWLKKHGFPQGRFQLLCGNCNIAKERNGGVLPTWRKGLRKLG